MRVRRGGLRKRWYESEEREGEEGEGGGERGIGQG